MRIAFFGTPEFAVPTLQALAKTSHTLNPVPFIIYDNYYKDSYKVKLGREDFGLSAVAATTVNLLGYEAPAIWDESMVELK